MLYCVYNCHVLTCIGQETIKYLILSYKILALFAHLSNLANCQVSLQYTHAPVSVRHHLLSSVVRPHFSKIFSPETTWPINFKFHVEPPSEGGTKVYINGPGHMTNMAPYGNKRLLAVYCCKQAASVLLSCSS